MKICVRFGLLIVLACVCFATPSIVSAQTPTPQPGGDVISGDQIIIANTFRLDSGDKLEGNLLVVGGTATISSGAEINGDIILTGGTISIAGTTSGDVVAIGGAVTLEDNAQVNGDLVLIGASLKRSPLAKIKGNITEQYPFDFNSEQFKFPFTPTQKPLTRVLNATLQALAMGILAVIIGLLLPNQLKRISDAAIKEPLVTGGVGLLSVVVVPIVLILITITIILIPVSILAIMVFALAVLMGFIAVGYIIGDRVAALFKTTWHASISAGIGTILLSLVTGIGNLIPCIGWLLGFIVGILGLGAVVVSRFGSSKYANRLVNAIIPGSNPEAHTPDLNQPKDE